MEIPTPGRIVHFVMSTDPAAPLHGKHRPAMVIDVLDEKGRCDLTVFVNGGKDGYINNQVAIASHNVEYDEDNKPGTWHWPERTAPAAKAAKKLEAAAAEKPAS